MASSDHRLYGYCLHGRHGVLHFDDFWPRSHAHLVGFSSSGVTKGAEHFGESRISWPGVECVTDRIRTYHKIFQRYKAWKLNIKLYFTVLVHALTVCCPFPVLHHFNYGSLVFWDGHQSRWMSPCNYISPKLTRADSTNLALFSARSYWMQWTVSWALAIGCVSWPPGMQQLDGESGLKAIKLKYRVTKHLITAVAWSCLIHFTPSNIYPTFLKLLFACGDTWIWCNLFDKHGLLHIYKVCLCLRFYRGFTGQPRTAVILQSVMYMTNLFGHYLDSWRWFARR